jgi:hypothetical protein
MRALIKKPANRIATFQYLQCLNIYASHTLYYSKQPDQYQESFRLLYEGYVRQINHAKCYEV